MKLKGISQKDLADSLGVSKSYVNQLFTLDKFLNMKTIAKLQNILDVKININTEPKNTIKKQNYFIDFSKLKK